MSSELAWSQDSLGPLPTLPPDVFTEQRKVTSPSQPDLRLALSSWVVGPSQSCQPLDLEGTIGGADPGPCCSWWLGLTGSLALKSPGLGVDLVGAPHPPGAPIHLRAQLPRGCSFPGTMGPHRRGCRGTAFSGSSSTTFPRIVLGWDLE